MAIGKFIGLCFLGLVVLGLYDANNDHNNNQPSAEFKFKVGDVVEADSKRFTVHDSKWPGAFNCFARDSSAKQLGQAIKALQNGAYLNQVPEYCQFLDTDYPYEIAQVADGPAEYGGHFYRVYPVMDGPVNKAQTIWVAFLPGHTALSTCKASPAADLSKPIVSHGINPMASASLRLPCQKT